ncbi:glucan 1,3-beta-glucosidase [Acrasis kona]|uniref:glucan 1,3-beta-glucosidase n=1 Tax=Acrasis kona TaxID=1008807 RepID=A0AAW2YXS8_9EUKA
MNTKCFALALLCVVAVNCLNISVSTDDHVAFKIRNGKLPMRGANVGAWLVAEHWMSSDSNIWAGVPGNIINQGEYQLMKYLGHGEGDKRFDYHRKVWFNESDVAEMAKFRLNAVRVPVGYWIVGFDKSGGGGSDDWKTFAPGGLQYLDQLIRVWARKYNIAVLVDLHATKGSQNGNEHSAPKNPGKSFFTAYQENVNNALDAIEFLVNRYKNEPAYLGFGCINEPSGSTSESGLKNFYTRAYDRIRATGSQHIVGVAPLLSQQGPWSSDWRNFFKPPQHQNIIHEWHKYFIWGFEGQNEGQILNYVYNGLVNDIKAWQGNWLFIGEWSLATNPSAPFNNRNQWNSFANGVIKAFNQAPGGWTFWSWKTSNDGGKNTWSMRSLLRLGLFPQF